ncbi:MAG: hypothetical protein SGJ27_00060 [Candidatus Melainabacteria bacterium]|nr:hypothetical protein [Candidatus Melainabacteria bacterium]
MYKTRNSKRNITGGALIETIVGLFVLIPVVLFMVDVVALVLAQMAHDALVKDCARAAAEVRAERPATPSSPEIVDGNKVEASILGVLSRFNNPVLVVNSHSWSNPGGDLGLVRVETRSTFTFPVAIPFAGNSSQVFVAEAIEPVVGLSERIRR